MFRPANLRVSARLGSAVGLLRAWCSRRLPENTLVEFRADVTCADRFDPQHLAFVPAGRRGIVNGSGLVSWQGLGYVVELLDDAGEPCGYWTGAASSDIRRVA